MYERTNGRKRVVFFFFFPSFELEVRANNEGKKRKEIVLLLIRTSKLFM